MTDFRFRPLRPVLLAPDVRAAYARWTAELDERLSDPATDRARLCRDVLEDIYALPEPGTAAANSLLRLQMDPRNVTLEPEYYAELDEERWARTKPLIWLWEMFDRSPLGLNVHLGVGLRRVLARHIFRRCGRNFKCFHEVKLSLGYNLEVGDDVVVHRHVLLDDRGGIRIGDGASISDYANVYSHAHDLADGRNVSTPATVIEAGARVTYHATLMAGVHVGRAALLGSLAVATRDVPSGQVAAGIPARPLKAKPITQRRPATADPLADAEPEQGSA